MGAKQNLEGKRFGRLLVAGPAYTPEGSNLRHWPCKCDCGRTTIVSTGSLNRGSAKSCGCLRTEVRREKIVKNMRRVHY